MMWRYRLISVAVLAALLGGAVLRHASGGTAPLPRRSGGTTAPLLRTVTVGVQPVDMQVDEQTGRAFVLNNGDDSVSMLDTHTGVLLGTIILKTPRQGPVTMAMTVDARAGRVVIMNVDKSVSVLDARTGRLLYTVPSGGASQQVVVNTRTGRIFVSNWGDFSVSPHNPDVDVFKGATPSP